jgi:hypothetical protein
MCSALHAGCTNATNFTVFDAASLNLVVFGLIISFGRLSLRIWWGGILFDGPSCVWELPMDLRSAFS